MAQLADDDYGEGGIAVIPALKRPEAGHDATWDGPRGDLDTSFDELEDGPRPVLRGVSSPKAVAQISNVLDANEPAKHGASTGFAVPLAAVEWLTRLADLATICAASVFAALLLNDWIPAELLANHGRMTLLVTALHAVIAESAGAYDVEVRFSVRRAWSRVLNAWLVTAFFTAALGLLLPVTAASSMLWVCAWFVIGGSLLALVRALVVVWSRRLKRGGAFNQRSAIFGADAQGDRIAKYILEHDKLTLSLVGFYDDQRRAYSCADGLALPFLGDMDALIADIRVGLIDQVIIAMPWSADNRLRAVVERLATTPVKIRLAPDKVSFLFAQRPVVLLGELPTMTLFERPISGVDQAVKWLEDKLVAGLLMIAISPLLLLVALAIKLDSPGPVFFRQPREGFNNRPFLVWKFRSMHVGNCATDNIVQAQRNDPRVTRVGAFLRRTSLDELPQLFNVVLGQMSLVGPRPHAPSTRAAGKLFPEIVASYAARHNVKPGLTGWAQACGWRGETDTERKLVKRLEHDLYYIENWSLWFDLYIMARTAATLLLQKTAY